MDRVPHPRDDLAVSFDVRFIWIVPMVNPGEGFSNYPGDEL
jgi:hypothetical protein